MKSLETERNKDDWKACLLLPVTNQVLNERLRKTSAKFLKANWTDKAIIFSIVSLAKNSCLNEEPQQKQTDPLRPLLRW
jgi:hypothetical protein